MYRYIHQSNDVIDILTDTRLDWQMFNSVQCDEQLVDFVVSFGEIFPKKDEKGNIITHPPSSPGLSTLC